MRTKQTARAPGNPQFKGTPISNPPTPTLKSPQAAELSEEDRTRLKQHLEMSDKPFTVTTLPRTKKRKRTSTSILEETNLYQERLNVHYEVKPARNWYSMKQYKKFTVGNESISLGECVIVKHSDADDQRVDLPSQWKARVLEVRALDPEHVYLRVAWLNRPEDLDSGRKTYHGRNELIPTNQLDIIDAMAVNGPLKVYAWDENDDNVEMPGQIEYFWRQTYDYAHTKTFSKLRLICEDETPQNPDRLILQCEHADCRKWMHIECIAENAARRASQATAKKGKSVKKQKTEGPKLALSPSASAIQRHDSHVAEFFVKGKPDGPDDTPSEETKIVITDGAGKKRTENWCCLLCTRPIEPVSPP